MKTMFTLLCTLWCTTGPLLAQQQWIKQHAIPVTDIDPEVQTGADLEAIKSAVQHKRIVVLGEQTHGTHEFSVYKNRLIRYLIKNCGFRLVLLETPYFDARYTDNLMRGGNVPADSLLANHYWCWKQEEMADLLAWMQAPAQHADGLHFGGFDMQDPAAAVQFLHSTLTTAYPELAAIVKQQLSSFMPYASLRQMSTYYALNDTVKHTCRQQLTAIHALLQQHEPRLTNTLGAQVVKELHQAVVVLLQAEFQYATFNVLARDSFMAENIRHLTQLYSNDKFIVWTHNLHAGHGPVNVNGFTLEYMGAYLKRHFGNEVYTLGFATYEGVCSMREGGKMTTYTLTQHEGSVEEVLHKTQAGNYLLPLAEADSFWLHPHPFRVIGLAASPDIEYPFDIAPALHFDALLFIDSTTPATPLRQTH